jgi:hypothetical protein
MAEEFVQAEIARAQLNSFHYLYQDAEWFRSLALTHPKSFDEVRICRTGILLYVLSLEALINRAMAEFVPDPLRTFLLEREANLCLQDKWLLLPMRRKQGESDREDAAQVRRSIRPVHLQQTDRYSGAGVWEFKEQRDGPVYVARQTESEHAMAIIQLGA